MTYTVTAVANDSGSRQFGNFIEAFNFLKRVGFESVLYKEQGEELIPLLKSHPLNGIQLFWR